MTKQILKKILILMVAASMVLPNGTALSFAEDGAEGAAAETETAAVPEEADAEETPAEEAGSKPAPKTAPAPENEPAKKAPALNGAEDEGEEEGPVGIGSRRYRTVKEAVDAAQDGDTITFYGDVKGRASAGAIRLTIDLNGNTWTAAGGSSKQFLTIPAGADVTIRNGTASGAKNLYAEDKAIMNSGKLTIENMTFTNNRDGVIKSEGMLVINDSVFTGNTMPSSVGGQLFLVSSTGAGAKAYLTNTVFKDNDRQNGGLIQASGSSYASYARNEMVLTGCDIKDNTINAYGSLYTSYYVDLTLIDTTIKNNNNLSTWDGAGGLYYSRGRITMTDSAVYGNRVPDGDNGNDIYLSATDDFNGEIPLPENMSDHGTKLTGYVMTELGYNYTATQALTSNFIMTKLNRYHRCWTIAKEAAEEGVCETGGTVYPTIKAAAEAAGENAVITLLKDVKAADTFTAKNGLVLDLNGHMVTPKSASDGLSIEGDEVTVKNGTLGGGTATGAVYCLSLRAQKATLEDLTIRDNAGRGVQLYHNAPLYDKDPAPASAAIRNCTFTGNGSNPSAYEPFALYVTGMALEMTDCTFDGNQRGFRYSNYTTGENETQARIERCAFRNHTFMAVEFVNSISDSAVFKDCVFEDNHCSGTNKALLYFKSAGSGANIHGGAKRLEGCTIRNNSGVRYTVDTEAGDFTLYDTLIEGNAAEYAGAVYVDTLSALAMIDSVVKNNEATGTARTCSGGICLFSATHILISPTINGVSYGGQQDLGFHSAGFVMAGGALYGNKTNMSSPAAEDLFVSAQCAIRVPAVADFKDGGKDFSGLLWKDDAVQDPEAVPAETSAERRYYKAGQKSVLKQIYVDGANGSDYNDGTRTAPVRTIEKAKELAEQNACRTILVLGTVSYPQAGTGVGLDSEDAPAEESVIDLDGIVLKRDPDFKTEPLVRVNEGALVTIRSAELNGNSQVSVKALAPLVKVEQGGTLVLEDGALLQQNGIHGANTNPRGGAVWCRGTLEMKDGAAIRENYAISGGGVLVDGGSFTMNGGAIEKNTALWRTGDDYEKSYGGGVCLINGGTMVLEDGLISENQGLHSGGGIALGTLRTDSVTNGTNRLYMYGGTIRGNKAYAGGGGIFVQCCTEAYVYGGTIENNLAQGSSDANYFAGGGIYVNGYHEKVDRILGIEPGRLYLQNAEIAGNEAAWEGGALAVCGTGRATVREIDGTVIYDNESYGKGSKYYKEFTGSPDGYNGNYDVLFDHVIYNYLPDSADQWVVYVPEDRLYPAFLGDRMLNGASYGWTDEHGDPVSAEQLKTIDRRLRLNTDAAASDKDVQKSVRLAKVHITGNRSESNGGGIGCNGELYVEKIPGVTEITAEKAWDDEGREDERPQEIKVDLLRNGAFYRSEIVKPDEDGNWKVTFEDLPEYEIGPDGKADKDKPYEYTVREDKDYRPEGSELTLGDQYTSEVREAEDGTVVITNTPVPPEDEDKEDEIEPEDFGGEDEDDVANSYAGKDEEEEESSRSGGEDEDEPDHGSGPKTGDENALLLWILLLAAAASAAAFLRKRI